MREYVTGRMAGECSSIPAAGVAFVSMLKAVAQLKKDMLRFRSSSGTRGKVAWLWRTASVIVRQANLGKGRTGP